MLGAIQLKNQEAAKTGLCQRAAIQQSCPCAYLSVPVTTVLLLAILGCGDCRALSQLVHKLSLSEM